MQLNADTRIAAILKQHSQALERIISISPKFEKLRNPFLRKLMAGRVSIEMAARMGNCVVDDFFEALRPLGFETESGGQKAEDKKQETPAFLKSIKAEQTKTLDVRPILESGEDPLTQILEKIKDLKQGEALKIINTFEPSPLLSLLAKKGFKGYVEDIGPGHIEIWFFRETAEGSSSGEEVFFAEGENQDGDWGQLLKGFAGNIREIDVRELEMPQPMMQILEALEQLPQNSALFVHHKRIPVFLLPELNQRNFQFRSREISDNEVHLLIFRS